MSRVKYTAVCIACKTRGNMPDMHTLPPDWDQLPSGDEICPKCIDELEQMLNKAKGRTNAP